MGDDRESANESAKREKTVQRQLTRSGAAGIACAVNVPNLMPMVDRRYNEQEVAEIFGRAAESQQDATRALPPGEGMTLAELQDIGQQVGMSAEAVADAARSLDRREPRFRRRLLGLTTGVGRSVALERRLSTDEWERLVVKVRETFDARGNVKSEGGLRQWTNGNLQVLVEPTEHGDRLRDLAPLGLMGAASFGIGLSRLRGWARVRGQQMDAIADWLQKQAP